MSANTGDIVPGKIFVGGVKIDTTSEALWSAFEQYGKIKDAFVMKDRNGRNRGFGFVEFESMDAANRVLADQIIVDGRHVDCKLAFPRDKKPPDYDRSSRSGGGGEGRRPPPRSPRGRRPDRHDPRWGRRLFIQGLDRISENEFVDHFTAFGELADWFVMKTRGFGFITYKDPRITDDVIARSHEIRGHQISVELAKHPPPAAAVQGREERERERYGGRPGPAPASRAPPPSRGPPATSYYPPQSADYGPPTGYAAPPRPYTGYEYEEREFDRRYAAPPPAQQQQWKPPPREWGAPPVPTPAPAAYDPHHAPHLPPAGYESQDPVRAPPSSEWQGVPRPAAPPVPPIAPAAAPAADASGSAGTDYQDVSKSLLELASALQKYRPAVTEPYDPRAAAEVAPPPVAVRDPREVPRDPREALPPPGAVRRPPYEMTHPPPHAQAPPPHPQAYYANPPPSGYQQPPPTTEAAPRYYEYGPPAAQAPPTYEPVRRNKRESRYNPY